MLAARGKSGTYRSHRLPARLRPAAWLSPLETSVLVQLVVIEKAFDALMPYFIGIHPIQETVVAVRLFVDRPDDFALLAGLQPDTRKTAARECTHRTVTS
jgi:hypothetical protein